jgi:hypothetical protein
MAYERIEAAATFNRPADTTTYASGDLVANSTTAGSVVPILFSWTRNRARPIRIKRVRLSKTSNTIALSNFRIHFYSASPTATNGDNGVFAAGTALGYLGYLDVVAGQGMASGAGGWSVAASDTLCPVATIAGGTPSIYGLIEARAAYVPTSGETFTTAIEVEDAELIGR